MHSGYDHDCFPQSRLRILTRFKGQRQKESVGFVVFVSLGEVQAHTRLAAQIALCMEDFVDFVCRVLLLGGQMVIFG